MKLSTRSSLQELKRVRDNSRFKKRAQVLSNGFGATWKGYDERVVVRSCDGSRESSQGGVLEGCRE